MNHIERVTSLTEALSHNSLTLWEGTFNNRIRITAFLIENNLPLILDGKLSKLMKTYFPDSKLANNLVINDKIVKNTASGLCQFLNEKAIETIKTQPFSLIVAKPLIAQITNNWALLFDI